MTSSLTGPQAYVFTGIYKFKHAARIWELRYNRRRPMKGGGLNKFGLILNEVSLAGT